MASAAFDYLVFPLLLPFICLWLLAARALSLVVPIFWPQTAMLARRLEWAVPFIPSIYAQRGRVLGGLIRFGFEFTYGGWVGGWVGGQALHAASASCGQPGTLTLPQPSPCRRSHECCKALPHAAAVPLRPRLLHCWVPQGGHHLAGSLPQAAPRH